MWRSVLALAVIGAIVGACDDSSGAGAPAGSSRDVPERAAPAAARRARLQRIGTFDAPVYVTAPRGDRRHVFVVEQGGTIRVIRDGDRVARPFLDIRSRVRAGGEQGLLSMAFAPDYAESGRFYVSYTDRSGDSNIVEYRRATATRADAGSARRVLFQNQPEANHNGGLILFGPDDLLYIGFGDGGGGGDEHGSRGNGQNLGTWLGKILRIDPRPSGSRAYSVPEDNPFRGRSGAKPEIWQYGLRNPWRFSFAPGGGIVIGDVGQNEVEEIDFARRSRSAGVNWGWRPFEGTRRYAPGESAPGHRLPILERTHDAGWCSITGGVVVRDRSLRLRGRYLFGDYCKGEILSGRLDTPRMRKVRRTGLRVAGLSSFGTDGRGRTYAISLNGPVYRLTAR